MASVQREFENPSGRPPEGVPGVDMVLVREHQAFPSPLDGDRALKKGCSEELGKVHGFAFDMDAEGGLVSTVAAVLLHNSDFNVDNSGLGDPTVHGKESYASKVVGSKQNEDNVVAAASFNDAEVVILEENVIMDRSGKDNPERVNGAVEGEPVVPKASVENISAKNLFCPWMVVDNRRMKPRLTWNSFNSQIGGQTASRFVFHQDDGGNNEVHDHVEAAVMVKNVAYQTSNSAKKTKSAKSGRQNLTVVPIMGGQDVQVSDRASGINLGQHRAIKIVEQGEHGHSGLVTGGVRGRSARGKDVLEPARRGVRIGKRIDSRIISKMFHVDFVKHISGLLPTSNHNLQDSDETLLMIQLSDEDDDYGNGVYHEAMDVGDVNHEEQGSFGL
ncbi:hypothetical protein V6N13_065820 [Hibiscus sabdariffa]|uniref:Uncharacterized protein n=1 Tax=Hibiscus sabdariffa TaxID=183260 RepID=A0ABR2QPQ4_9ROSI